MQLKKPLNILFGLGIFIVIFPWLFSYQGVFFGQPISIRALGDVLGISIALFGILILVNARVRERLLNFAHELNALPSRIQNRILLSTAFLFVAGAISHKLRAHYLLHTHAYDLGFFSNICWNIAQGNGFYSSELERNFMGVHVNWILWPLSYFYRIWAGAPILLVAQALIMGAAVPLLWKIAQKITGSFAAGAIAALLLVCSPYFEHALSNDFHPDVWLLPCLFAALWAWHVQQRSWMFFFCALSLLAKEDVSVVVCGFGLMLLFLRGWRPAGITVILIGLGAFYFHTQVVVPRSLDGQNGSLLFSRYPFLGRNYHEFVRNIFFEPSRFADALAYQPSKYMRLLYYLFPVAGLVLFAPFFLIPPIISVLPHILSQAGTQLSLADIYSMPSQPFLFVGAVIGAKRLIDRYGNGWIGMLSGALILVAGIGAFRSPRYFKSTSAARVAAFRELRQLVPRDATLAAQHCLQPHFETRRFIQLFPIRNTMIELQRRVLENPEYIVCDRFGNGEPGTAEQLQKAFKDIETNRAYEKIFEREGFLVFHRRRAEPMLWRTVG